MASFVYILRSSRNGRYYVSYSSDPLARLTEQNAGNGTSTRGRGPWDLAYVEECLDSKAARQRERKLKSTKSRTRLESLISSVG